MKPIVITPELISDVQSEINTINELIHEFGCRVHIRKKQCTMEELDYFCRLLSEHTDTRYLTLHGNAALVEKYHFGGFHDKQRGVLGDNFLYSMSCHSTEEAETALCDYLFLSPLFDSISKQGYRSAYDFERLKKWLGQRKNGAKIVALGGIDANNVKIAYELGFDGVALLGAIWNENNATKNYNNILKNL